MGFAGGAVVGLERLCFRNFSDHIHKAHEILALIGFTGLFLGVAPAGG